MFASRDRLFALAALVLLLGTSLPFLDQALHIDDQIYIMGAEIIEADPARPYSARRGFLGMKVPYYRGINSHPEGLPYYLAALRAVTGAEGEAAHHALMLPWLALLLLGAWGLARELGPRDGAHPGVTALLLLSCAPVLVNGHTIMTDVPFMALFTAGLWAFIRCNRAGGAGWIALAVLLCNYAWFMQYRGLLLLPIGVGWLLYSRRAPARSIAVLASVPLLFAGWCLWNQWELGKAHFFFSGGQIEFTVGRLALSGLAMAAYAGGALFPLCLLVVWHLRGNRLVLSLLAGVSLAAAAALLILAPARVPGPDLAMFLLAAVGAFLLLGALLAALASEREHAWPLAATLGALAALQVVASLFASARMLLLPLPFLMLALVGGPKPAPRKLVTAVLCLNLLLGLGISLGDYRYANAYRALAPEVAREATAGGGDGWFVGEWGLRNYLEAQGLRYLTTYDLSPRKGDRVVIPGLNCPWPLHEELQKRLGEPTTLTVPGTCAIRTMDPALGAGFYSDGYGVLPFALTARGKPYDVLKVYPVIR